MIRTVPNYTAPIESLFNLANTPFAAAPFRQALEKIAKFNKSYSHDTLWYYSFDGQAMIVGLDDAGAVRGAVLSICWWETYLPTEHPDLESFQAERIEFDHLYTLELKAAINSLGPPQVAGQEQDDMAHRWAIWRGRTGLFILQQSAYDPQFGLDVNYWLHPWEGDDPCPTRAVPVLV